MEIVEIPGAGYVTYQMEATAPLAFTRFVRPLIAFENSVGAAEQASATIDNAIVQLTSTVTNNCNAADLAEPFGTLDLGDIGAFVTGFSNMTAVADLDENNIWDLNDISLFVTAFTGGCP